MAIEKHKVSLIKDAIKGSDPTKIAELANSIARAMGEYLDLKPQEILYAFAAENIVRIITRGCLAVTLRRAGEKWFISVEALERRGGEED